MSDNFDPYYQWLGIRDPERPPNHYRLLGIDLLETNEEVIHTAADRQMAHVRTFQNGPHSGESQRLLNEIAAAKICLLDPEKRDIYNDWLAARHVPAASGADETPIPPINVAIHPAAALRPPGKSTRDQSFKGRWSLAVVPMLLVLVVLVGYRLYRDHRNGLPRLGGPSATPTEDAVKPSEELPPPRDESPETNSADAGATDRNGISTPHEGAVDDGAASLPAKSDSAANQNATSPTDSGNANDARPAEESVVPEADTSSTANNAGSVDTFSDRGQSAGESTDVDAFLPPMSSWADLPEVRPDVAGKFAISDPIGSPLTLMANRDLVAARSALQSLIRSPAPTVSTSQARDAEMIYAALDQFWQAVADGQKTVSVGQTLIVRSMMTKVLERGTTFLKLEDPAGAGRVFDTRRGEIDPTIAIALVENHFRQSLPAAWRLIAVFLAVDHNGDRQLAEHYVDLAESRGFSAEFLTLTVKQLTGESIEGHPPLPPQATANMNGRSNPSATGAGKPADASNAAAMTVEANPNIPDKAKQAEIRRTVYVPLIEKWKSESIATAEWPKRFLEAAAEPDRPAVDRYVLLKAALQRATVVPDLDSALKAIDALTLEYELEPNDLRYKMIQAIVRRVKGEARRPYVSLVATWIDLALQEDRFDDAVRFGELAETVGKVVPDTFYRRHLSRHRAELNQIRSMAAELAPMREQLSRQPNDPTAKAALARFRVLAKGDFDRGLQELSDTADETLHQVVMRELSGVSDQTQQMQLGVAWYDLARTLRGVEQANALRRSRMWLTMARTTANREQAEGIQERLDGVAGILGRESSTLDLTTVSPVDVSVGFGTFGVNRNPDAASSKARNLPELNGKKIDRFLWACAPSKIEYLLPSGVKVFRATVLVNAPTVDGVQFAVYADDAAPLYVSPPIRQIGVTIPIQVKIPDRARTLKLIVDPIKTNTNDHAYWVGPELGF